MRLRLNIQRHGLPSVKLLWNANGPRSNEQGGGRNTSFAQLLEQLNEIVPLESDHWGLEDYTIQVNGFDCLHFLTLDQLLREDDEVTIRPFHTREVRERTLSGRVQITEDGRHLYDGVAFGRPLLKRPSRPEIKIPAPKRARLTVGSGQHDGTLTGAFLGPGGGQLVLADEASQNVNEELDSDEGELEDNHEQDNEDLTDELRGLEQEQKSAETTSGWRGPQIFEDSESPNLDTLHIPKKRKQLHGLGIHESTMHTGADSIESGTPTLVRNLSHGRQNAIATRLRSIQRAGSAPGPRKSPLVPADAKHPGINSRHSSRSSPKSVRFESDELETPATILAADLSDDSDDESFDSQANSYSEESDKENLKPRVSPAGPSSLTTTQERDTLDLTSSDDSTSSSDTSSDSDSDSDAESDQPSTETSDDDVSKTSSSGSSDSDSDSSSDSDSDSDSVDERPDELKTVKIALSSLTNGKMAMHNFPPIPPGTGLRRTQKRNQRRNLSKKLNDLKTKGVLHANATLRDYLDWKNGVTHEGGEVQQSDDLEKKRQSLLAALESDFDDNVADAQSEPPKDNQEATSPTATTTVPESHSADNLPEHEGPKSPRPQSQTEVPTGTTTPAEATKRRAKLDLAGSRRMLFGSLGLKTPKTKADENTLREKLAQSVKEVAPNPRLEDDNVKEHTAAEVDASWQSHINLKAVECCYESVELSAPPFPFVQRWDKSQRGPYGSSRNKRKHKSQHLEDAVTELDYDDIDQDITGISEYQADDAEHQEPAQETFNEETPIDLPPLPKVISTLPVLRLEDALVGAVIVFKYIEMSAATNWEPVFSDFKTATIDSISDKEDMELTLAQRDRVVNCSAIDATMGERAYSKFEMPGMDDADDGYLALNYDAMQEPYLLRASNLPKVDDSTAVTQLNNELQSTNAMTTSSKEVSVAVEEQRYTSEPGNPHPNQHEDMTKDVQAEPSEAAKYGSPKVQPALRGSQDEAVDETTEVVSSAKRREYSMLIRNAGFHSDVPSEVHEPLNNHLPSSSARGDNDLESEFHGFDSSPTHNATGHSLHSEADQNQEESHANEDIDSGTLKDSGHQQSNLEVADTPQPNSHDNSGEVNFAQPNEDESRSSLSFSDQRYGDSFIELDDPQFDSVDLDLIASQLKPGRTDKKKRLSSIQASSPRLSRPSAPTPNGELSRMASYVQTSDASDGEMFPMDTSLQHSDRAPKGASHTDSRHNSPATSLVEPTLPTTNAQATNSYEDDSWHVPSSPLFVRDEEDNASEQNDNSPSQSPASDLPKRLHQHSSRTRTSDMNADVVDLTQMSDPVSPREDDPDFEPGPSEGSSLPKGPGWVKKLRSRYKESQSQADEDTTGPRTRSSI